MRCYAFRRGGKEESLYQHVMGIVGCLSEAWETRGLKRKMERIYGMTEDKVNDMLLLAAIIHDLGKTRKELQERCEREECASFKYHYITSAQLALRLGYRIPELGLSPDNIDKRLGELLGGRELQKLDLGGAYLLMVVMPALLHHYAQVPGELSVLEGLRSAGVYLEIHGGCVEELERVIDEARKYFRSKVGLSILEELKKLVKEGSVELSVISDRTFQNASMSFEYAPGRLVAEAATGLLNICDGRVASANRA